MSDDLGFSRPTGRNVVRKGNRRLEVVDEEVSGRFVQGLLIAVSLDLLFYGGLYWVITKAIKLM